MNPHDVLHNEMHGPDNFDDQTIEELLTGRGHDRDPGIAAFVAALRNTHTTTAPALNAELEALIYPAATAAPNPSPWARRRSLLAKMSAAGAAVIAATSGLAVAGALPAPVQHVISDLGLSTPTHHSARPTEAAPTTTTIDTTTTFVDNTTPTTAANNHGAQVSVVAHDHTTTGCDHGHAVATVASNDKSHGQPCHTPNSSDTTTPTSRQHDDNNNSGHPPNNAQGNGQTNNSDGGTSQTGNGHGGGH
jgi:hypothetical protein